MERKTVYVPFFISPVISKLKPCFFSKTCQRKIFRLFQLHQNRTLFYDWDFQGNVDFGVLFYTSTTPSSAVQFFSSHVHFFANHFHTPSSVSTRGESGFTEHAYANAGRSKGAAEGVKGRGWSWWFRVRRAKRYSLVYWLESAAENAPKESDDHGGRKWRGQQKGAEDVHLWALIAVNLRAVADRPKIPGDYDPNVQYIRVCMFVHEYGYENGGEGAKWTQVMFTRIFGDTRGRGERASVVRVCRTYVLSKLNNRHCNLSFFPAKKNTFFGILFFFCIGGR